MQIIKNTLKKVPGVKYVKNKITKKDSFNSYVINEISQVNYKFNCEPKNRINLLTTSINDSDVFAGIKTALDFFNGFSDYCNAEKRIIVMDKKVVKKNYISSNANMDDIEVIDASDRSQILDISENDIFIATMWHTAYSLKNLFNSYRKKYKKNPILIYLIQDYEPGFFPWSSRFLLAQSTYKLKDVKTLAVFNSKILKDYFCEKGSTFYKEYYFDPKLNASLKRELINSSGIKRKNQILIYGRPSKMRNCFSIILMALNEWYITDPNAKKWKIISAGEEFGSIKLPSGLIIKSVGKLSITNYAKLMLETKVGISLMASPHPSYPPLEMSTFGIKTIVNSFENKNLSNFNNNIRSIQNISIENLVNKLQNVIRENEDSQPILHSSYLEDYSHQWLDIFSNLRNDIVIIQKGGSSYDTNK